MISIGPTNDCSICQGGSWGTCAPDELECKAGGVPWHVADTCGGDNYVAAGANGCAKCPHLRAICATTCNWCTPNGVTLKSTAITRLENYSTKIGKHLINIQCLNRLFCDYYTITLIFII